MLQCAKGGSGQARAGDSPADGGMRNWFEYFVCAQDWEDRGSLHLLVTNCATMGEVATAVGIGVDTVYKTWPNKADKLRREEPRPAPRIAGYQADVIPYPKATPVLDLSIGSRCNANLRFHLIQTQNPRTSTCRKRAAKCTRHGPASHTDTTL